MNKKIVAATVLAAGALLANSAPAFGAVSCVTQYGGQYGGGQVCVKTGELQINKEVFNPKLGKFVDNIPATGTDANNFAPGDEVKFRLTIKNSGDNTLDKVQVTDTLPSTLEQISGQTYSFEITNLAVGQSVDKEIKARFVDIAKLPKDRTVICEVNTAVAQSGNKMDRDTAQVCVERKVAKELPKAGAEDTLITLLSSGAFGYIGAKLIGLKKQ